MVTIGDMVPDWMLERYRLGELAPAEHERVRAALASGALQQRLERLESSDGEILAALPAERVAVEVRQRLNHRQAPSRSGLWRRAVAAPLCAVVAAALLILIWPAPPTERLKGLEPHLVVHRKAASVVEVLAEGSPVRTRDLLQLSYIAAGHRYGVVLSIDGRGAVTLHLPETDGQAAELEQAGEVALSAAYELDNAPAFERFFIVTANRPFATVEVMEAARRLARVPQTASRADLSLPADLRQRSILLRKENP